MQTEGFATPLSDSKLSLLSEPSCPKPVPLVRDRTAGVRAKSSWRLKFQLKRWALSDVSIGSGKSALQGECDEICWKSNSKSGYSLETRRIPAMEENSVSA